MRKLILSVLTVFLMQNTFAQSEYILPSNVKINGFAAYGTPITTFAGYFGTPTEITSEYSETEETHYKAYKYQGANFFFIDDKLSGFEIKGPNWNFKISSTSVIKVGDSINKLSNLFPAIYAQRANGSLGIDLKDTDEYILIDYNENNIITSIEHRSY